MSSNQNTVYYCCVARGNKIFYAYNNGDHEMDTLALLCLENTPPFHKWYFETTGKMTFSFLIEGGYVYFIIVDNMVENAEVLRFLEHLRDEFKKFERKGSTGKFSSMNSLYAQEHIFPSIPRLVASFESDTYRAAESPSPSGGVNLKIEVSSSTKAPLLGKSSKQESKKAKDHVIAMRDIGLGEHRKSTDRGADTSDSVCVSLDSCEEDSSIRLQKDLVPARIRSASQSIRKKWWHQVRIVLAIDAAICLVLFVIWLGVCRGIECVR